ncbi:hypothetical protein S7711_05688 [Stachybotrys chartarum IBT 7711]|uniref:DAGKc domain-containing protein n=1 Tax=Stachybotrys chartarum (strain CBS 109288 / IBT 7711) TaxID=1280523 RepID=A0A084B1J8_STACB|nr:hypothetical protein S7711_05688 [Stachybotrys chartarum IBT 7711]
MAAPIETPVASPVSEVQVNDGALTWKDATGTAGTAGPLKLDEVILVLKSEEGHTICGLKEQTDSKESHYQLVLLSTNHLPDSLQSFELPELPSYLRHDESNEVDVIVSTNSGLKMSLPFWQTVLQPLWATVTTAVSQAEPKSSASGVPYNVLVTESAHDVPRFAKSLWNDKGKAVKSRTIVLLSGDGGVVDLLNGSQDYASDPSSVVLAVLPFGTGNALLHSLQKPLYKDPGPSPLVLSLRSLFKGASAPLPVFRADFSPGSSIVTFTDKSKTQSTSDSDGPDLKKEETSVSHLYGAIVASYAFHASLIFESDTPEYRVHGDKRFGMVAQDLLRESHLYKARVDVARPGAPRPVPLPEEEHAYILVTFVSNLERTFTISPASRPLDGRLRLNHLGPLNGDQVMAVMMAAYADGKHVDREEVRYEEIEQLRVEMREEDDRWRKVCIDGTSVEIPQGGHMAVSKVQASPFRILVDPSLVK